MDNHNAYDYGSEVFDSGQDSFDTQWAAINEIHEDGIHEGDKGFTTSDEEDNETEDGIKDAGWVNLATNKEADDNEAEDGTQSSLRTSPGVRATMLT